MLHPSDSGSAIGRSPWPEGEVACIWLPQLPLRVELLRHPAWDGRPLVLGSGPGERKVVQLCSPEAERAGIQPGLPLREVLALCREAIVLQPDPVRVAEVIEDVLDKLRRVGPSVELGADQFFLHLRGLRGLYHGDLALLERAIRTAIPPLLRPRIGVGGGKYAASVAARLAPPSAVRVVPPTQTAAFLAPLPVTHLPLAPELLRWLDLLGLRAIGDLVSLPFSAVQAELGPSGARAWRLANGLDDEPVIPSRFSPIVRASLRFDDPLASAEAVFAVLRLLLARAFGPTLQGRATRQACLRALLADDTSWERLVTFKEALSTREAVYRALEAKLRLPNALPLAPIQELSVELLGLSAESARQPSLFLARARQLEAIAEAARQLRARYGRVPLYHIVEVEPWSRIPERRWALVPCDP